ncbi:exonuclease domain-containing protein [Marinobacter sp.]|uniref:3'-5' exonuclease n=1 Tax=Marinobacter sp. TaxID=50741 RepID=UPI00356A0C82
MDLKQHAAELARFWLHDNAVIIDTETTGLTETDEIVEISVINCHGNTLLDTLVRPAGEINPAAQAVHGITLAETADSPTFDQVLPELLCVIQGKTVVMYNSSYDARLIQQSAMKRGCIAPTLYPHCAMKTYAKFYGQWDDYRENWKWQSLDKAARQCGVTVDGNAHRALTDCHTTLGVIKAMAAYHPAAA